MIGAALKRLFGAKGPMPTQEERAACAQVVALLGQRVFCGPAEGELPLTGDTAADAVPNFYWTHNRACQVVTELLHDGAMPTRVRSETTLLCDSARRVAELLAPPVAKIEDVPEASQADLAFHMKRFLQQIATIGEAAKGGRWPASEGAR
jgi:hypothetical protein